jgi:hypothetical protein
MFADTYGFPEYFIAAASTVFFSFPKGGRHLDEYSYF